MNKDRLKDILSIPSCFGYENLIRDYITTFGIRNGIRVNIDVKGNIYLIKGQLDKDEYYPCVCAHMDTVYRSQIPMVEKNKRLNVIEDNESGETLYSLNEDMPGGIGGDDKCGVAICLELLLTTDKLVAAFFVEEENGCHGSKEADKNIFKNVGYIIEFDAPGDNWCTKFCSGVKIHNQTEYDLIKPILDDYGVTRYSNDPYTDVSILRPMFGISCFNFFAGYYCPHGGKVEFVVLEDVEKALSMGEEVIKLLGNKKRLYKK